MRTHQWLRMFSEELVIQSDTIQYVFIHDPEINMKMLLGKKYIYFLGDRWKEWKITVRDRFTLEKYITEQHRVIRIANLCTSNKGFPTALHSLLLHKGGFRILDTKGLYGQYWKISQSEMLLLPKSSWHSSTESKGGEWQFQKNFAVSAS